MPRLVHFCAFAELPEEQITEKISRRIVSGDQGMIVWWSIGAGVHVEPHSHSNEQIVKLARRTPNILVDGVPVLVVWDDQARAWFKCRLCGRRCKHAYLDELACRICCALDYASRHLHRSVTGVHRVMRWRRQLGIDTHPFAPIPQRPKHHTRYHRIVAAAVLSRNIGQDKQTQCWW